MEADEIKDWLDSLTPGTKVYIDDGGLTLRSTLDPDTWIEVGGHTPECETCGGSGMIETELHEGLVNCPECWPPQ